jgi:hypothetical protein
MGGALRHGTRCAGRRCPDALAGPDTEVSTTAKSINAALRDALD